MKKLCQLCWTPNYFSIEEMYTLKKKIVMQADTFHGEKVGINNVNMSTTHDPLHSTSVAIEAHLHCKWSYIMMLANETIVTCKQQHCQYHDIMVW